MKHLIILQRLACNMSRLLWIQCLLLLLTALCECSPLTATAIKGVVPVTTVEEVHYPQYAFSYAVNDPHTNDKKAHWETRHGDEVNGAYSLLDPDGTVRIVEYNANDHKGFTAVVKKIGDSVHPTDIIRNVPITIERLPQVTEQTVQPLPVPIPLQPPPQVTLFKPVISHRVPLQTNIKIAQQIPIETGHKITQPLSSYGLGAAALSVGVPNVVYEKGSHPWDPVTGSYGGWRPLRGSRSEEPYATIYSRKTINGNLHKLIVGPISLVGKTLYIKKSHR